MKNKNVFHGDEEQCPKCGGEIEVLKVNAFTFNVRCADECGYFETYKPKSPNVRYAFLGNNVKHVPLKEPWKDTTKQTSLLDHMPSDDGILIGGE